MGLRLVGQGLLAIVLVGDLLRVGSKGCEECGEKEGLIDDGAEVFNLLAVS